MADHEPNRTLESMIVARKPRSMDAEYVIVNRGYGLHPFVVGTVTAHSLSYGEWFWGHYFRTIEAATDFFNKECL